MKRTMMAVLAALMTALTMASALGESGTQTPRAGLAVAAPADALSEGTVPVFEAADETSAVQMNYYSGTTLEVLEVLEGGMVKVRAGTEDAHIDGYMRSDDLRYGAQAMREVPRCHRVVWYGAEVPVYDSMGKDRKLIDKTNEFMSYIAGGAGEDGWLQLCSRGYVLYGGWINGNERGFVKADAVDTTFSYPSQFIVQPVEGEMSHEQAYDRAIELALDNQAFLTHLTEAQKTDEGLRAMWADIRLLYSMETGKAVWQVTFQQDAENFDQNAMVSMEADGTLISIDHGNG